MGRKAVTKIGRKRGEKSIRLIGDMGFAMEELLFDGRRLFHHPQPGGYHYMVCKWTLHSEMEPVPVIGQCDPVPVWISDRPVYPH
jgi:hypothetical protein